MGQNTYDVVHVMSPARAKIMRLKQAAPRWPEVLRLLVIAPLGYLLLSSAMMFSQHIWINASAKAALLANPVALVQIAIAFLAFLTVFLWQLSTAISRLSAKRIIVIEGSELKITERRLSGKRQWGAPMASYTGLLYQTRTTLGGPVATVTLVHEDPDLSLLLASGQAATSAEIALLAERFHLPELSPAALALRHRQGQAKGARDVTGYASAPRAFAARTATAHG